MSMRRLPHLSFSQFTTYADCGERYRLTKGYGLGDLTWWATLAGSVIHELTEKHDKGEEVLCDRIAELHDTFKKALDAEAAKAGQVEIKASGSSRKELGWAGGPSKRDYHWWIEYGPRILYAYLQWRESTEWEVATVFNDEGVWPGVELGFNTPFGGVNIQGSIDRIFWDQRGERHIIVDLKTGTRDIYTQLQLATYRVALERETGMRVDHAGFAKPYVPKGEETVRWWCEVKDMHGWHAEYVDHLYAKAREGIESNLFLPNVNACGGCPVADFCHVRGGDLAAAVPAIEPPLDSIPAKV